MEILAADFQSIRRQYRQFGATDSEVRTTMIEAVVEDEIPQSWGLLTENSNAIEDLNNACRNILNYVNTHWRNCCSEDEFSQLVDGLDDMLLDA